MESSLSYLFNTPDERRQMLDVIGVESIEAIFQRQVPDALRLKRSVASAHRNLGQLHQAMAIIEPVLVQAETLEDLLGGLRGRLASSASSPAGQTRHFLVHGRGTFPPRDL